MQFEQFEGGQNQEAVKAALAEFEVCINYER
jgi:hypothetical protein